VELLASDVRRTMALIGCRGVADLHRDLVERAYPPLSPEA
jgi:isopentenyl diphosphate isomerase/L-lactate dehydrogenase-like FMN-dependent dehydrogenase